MYWGTVVLDKFTSIPLPIAEGLMKFHDPVVLSLGSDQFQYRWSDQNVRDVRNDLHW